MSEWQTIESAPTSDDDEQPRILLLQDGRRFLAYWDPAAGHWQGSHAFDGVERDLYFQEWPGRLYSPTHWMPLPEPPSRVLGEAAQVERASSRDEPTNPLKGEGTP